MDFSCTKPFPDGSATVSNCYSYLDCDVLVIDRYVPSRLDYESISLAQDELPGGGTIVYFEKVYYGSIALRVPSDPSLTIRTFIDNEEYDPAMQGMGDQPRYALLGGPFEAGCRVRLEIIGEVKVPVDTANTDTVVEPVDTNNNETVTEFADVNNSVTVTELGEDEKTAVNSDIGDDISNDADNSSATDIGNDTCNTGVADVDSDSDNDTNTDIASDINNDIDSDTVTDTSDDIDIDTCKDSAKECDHKAVATSEVSPQPNFPSAIHDPSMQLRTLHVPGSSIFFNDMRSRFFIKQEMPGDSVLLALPLGYDFEVDGHCSGNTHTFDLSDNSFTGYSMRVYSQNHISYRDFDLAILKYSEDSQAGARTVHAYTPITGAFSGEACYILDRTGSVTESATHGSYKCSADTIDCSADAIDCSAGAIGFSTGDVPAFGIDPSSGYKWGHSEDGYYHFELENGGYELTASFTGTGARLISSPGTSSERVIIRETTEAPQRYGIRITDGELVLAITEVEEINFATLIIRALDTTAVQSGYEPLNIVQKEIPADFTTSRTASSGSTATKTEAAARVIASGSVKPTAIGTVSDSCRQTPPGVVTNPKGTAPFIKVQPEVQKHINNGLAINKNKDTIKSLGIVTGALAVAAGILSLLKKDD